MNRAPPPSLGAAVNLLHGAAGLALASPPRAPLRRFAADVAPGSPYPWGPPRVTLHDGPASLAARLCLYRVVPFRFDGPGFSIEPMLLRDPHDEPALARQVESLLRVRLAPGACCLLFERRRLDGRADHEAARPPARREFDRERHLTPEWRVASSRLRPGRHIHDGSEQDAMIATHAAQAYVDCFYDYGTHFVSAVEVGDVLFQAIVLRPDLAPAVRDYWLATAGGGPVDGDAALPFHVFASPAYALHAGPVVSLAGDAAILDLAANDANASLRLLAGPAPFGVAPAAPRTATAIGVELSSLGRFMEFHRGRNFERVLRGALLQRWGKRVNTTLRRLPGVVRALAADVLPGDADRIAALTAPGTVRCARVLDLRQATHHVAGAGVVLAQFVDAAPCTADAPIIRLPDDRFDQPGLACATLAGALVLENASGTRRDAVVDGFRFTSEADGQGRPRVRVRGDLAALPPVAPAALQASLHAALQRTARALAFADAGDEWPRSAAASFAGWLADMQATSQHAAPALRAWAASLSRLERHLPPLPPWDERARPGLAAIGSAAVRAGEHLRSLALRHDTAAAHDALDAIDRDISRRYLALLDDSRAPIRAALAHAGARHTRAAAALAAAAAPFDAGAAMSDVAALEMRMHAHARQLDALDTALAALGTRPLQFQAAADAFAAIDLGAGAGADMATVESSLAALCNGDRVDAVRAAWEEYDAARRTLFAARATHARLLLDTWQHAYLLPALRHGAHAGLAPDEAPMHLLELARLSILTTLGQAGQRLPRMPRAAGGDPAPDVVGLAFIHLPPFPEHPTHA